MCIVRGRNSPAGDQKRQTVIRGGCFNIYYYYYHRGVASQYTYTCVVCRFLHDNNNISYIYIYIWLRARIIYYSSWNPRGVQGAAVAIRVFLIAKSIRQQHYIYIYIKFKINTCKCKGYRQLAVACTADLHQAPIAEIYSNWRYWNSVARQSTLCRVVYLYTIFATTI